MKYLFLLLVSFVHFPVFAEDHASVDEVLREAFSESGIDLDGYPENISVAPEDYEFATVYRDLFQQHIVAGSDQRLKLLLAITSLNNVIDYYIRGRIDLADGPILEGHRKRLQNREILAKELVRIGVLNQEENSAPDADPRLASVLEVVFKTFAPRVVELSEDVVQDPERVMETATAQNLFHREIMEAPDVQIRILFAIICLNTIISQLENPEIDLDANEGMKKDYLQMIKHRDYLIEESVKLGEKQSQ